MIATDLAGAMKETRYKQISGDVQNIISIWDAYATPQEGSATEVAGQTTCVPNYYCVKSFKVAPGTTNASGNDTTVDAFTKHENMLCSGSEGNAWIVPKSSKHRPKNCKGYNQDKKTLKCRYTKNNTPINICKELCLKESDCSGFTQDNGSCFFRQGSLNKTKTAGMTCYEKTSTRFG